MNARSDKQDRRPLDWFAIIGTFSLGIVVIWLVRLFAVQLKQPQIKWLTSLFSALLGGAALGFLGKFTQQKVPWPREFWCYPMGLAVGLLLFMIVDVIGREMDHDRRRRR
jgi:hypothetical protein